MCNCSNAPHPFDRQRREKLFNGALFGWNYGQAVGFIHIGGDFGEKHVRGYADRGGQSGLFTDVAPYFFCNFVAASEEALCTSDIEEGFVDGEGLNEGGVGFKDAHDMAGNRFVAGHIDGKKNGVAAFLVGGA